MPRPCAVEFHVLLQREFLRKMPRPCAVEFHVCCYKESFSERCHGLRRGVSRLLLQREFLRKMPRPCAVEFHVLFYKESFSERCHGLAPWSFTFVATKRVSPKDATALRRGVSRLLLQREVSPKDATALRRGVSRLLLQREFSRKMPRLAPWSFTFVATFSEWLFDQ